MFSITKSYEFSYDTLRSTRKLQWQCSKCIHMLMHKQLTLPPLGGDTAAKVSVSGHLFTLQSVLSSCFFSASGI